MMENLDNLLQIDKKKELFSQLSYFLTYKQFDYCIELCSPIFKNCKQLSCDERNTNSDIENLCLTTIQAYAELDRWSEVLPFVTQLYNGIEDCPPKVVQACFLLHIKVKDFPTSTAISNIWLRNPNNFHLPQYSSLVELYIANLLIPFDKWPEIRTFLQNCPGLTDNQKELYLKCVKTIERKKEQAEIDKVHLEDNTIEGTEEIGLPVSADRNGLRCKNNGVSETTSSQNDEKSKVSQQYQNYVEKVTGWVKRNIPVVSMFVLKNFTLLAVIVYIVITKGNFEMMTWDHLSSLKNAVVYLWKSMFAPFHIARSN